MNLSRPCYHGSQIKQRTLITWTHSPNVILGPTTHYLRPTTGAGHTHSLPLIPVLASSQRLLEWWKDQLGQNGSYSCALFVTHLSALPSWPSLFSRSRSRSNTIQFVSFAGQSQLWNRLLTDDRRDALGYEPCERCRERGGRCARCKVLRVGGGYIILDGENLSEGEPRNRFGNRELMIWKESNYSETSQ